MHVGVCWGVWSAWRKVGRASLEVWVVWSDQEEMVRGQGGGCWGVRSLRCARWGLVG